MQWEKEEAQNISGNKSKRRSIRVKVDLYEVFISCFIYCFLYYIMNLLTPICFTIFLVYITPRERSSGSIGHKDSIWNSKSNNMDGIVQGC